MYNYTKRCLNSKCVVFKLFEVVNEYSDMLIGVKRFDLTPLRVVKDLRFEDEWLKRLIEK